MIPPFATYMTTAVTSLIGTNPVRFWPFASAPQPPSNLYGTPYAVWQLVYGSPENYINQTPDIDSGGYQIDAYATTVSEARAVLYALRDAFEPHGHVVAYNGEEKDIPTGLYRAGMTFDFWAARGS
jgi:hypothetical protein